MESWITSGKLTSLKLQLVLFLFLFLFCVFISAPGTGASVPQGFEGIIGVAGSTQQKTAVTIHDTRTEEVGS